MVISAIVSARLWDYNCGPQRPRHKEFIHETKSKETGGTANAFLSHPARVDEDGI
jgi:hypothetical protein